MQMTRSKAGAHIGLAALALAVAPLAHPQTAPATEDEVASRLKSLKLQVDEQTKQLEALRKLVAEQEANVKSLQRAVAAEVLATQRGGQAGSAAPEQSAPAPSAQPAAQQAETVGQPPAEGEPLGPLSVARILELPGVLTQRGQFVLEPSLAYSYSSSLRVSIVGYSILPALLVGLIDVRDVRRNTWTAALRGSYGITNRFEIEGRIPYIYRSDSAVGREFLEGSAVPAVFDSTGNGIGDIELTARYQLNEGGADKPYFVGSLRFKSRTGKDPFEVTTIKTIPGFRGEGVQTELPTGSGFNGLQPGLTVLYPSDPVVFFGSINYLYSFPRDNIKLKTDEGYDDIGRVAPGGIFGFNMGVGLGLNDKFSLSFGYDHNSVEKTKINGKSAPDAVRLQLGTLLIGGSYRLSPTNNLNVTLGIGVTRDSPDLSLSVRTPMSF